MAEKVLVVKGSVRKNSFTNELVNRALDGIDGIEVSVFDAGKHHFEFCKGCDSCFETGKCVFRDLDGFFEEFEKTDVIVIASPVWNGGFSTPVKALIDRFQVYYNSFYKNGKTQPISKKRKAVLIAAAGRDGTESLGFMEKCLKRVFSVSNVAFVGSVMCSFTDESFEPACVLRECELLLKRSLKDEKTQN